MKVRMLVCRAGADGVNDINDVIEVGEAEAKRMIDAGQAEAVAGEQARDASASSAEHATARPKKKAKKKSSFKGSE